MTLSFTKRGLSKVALFVLCCVPAVLILREVVIGEAGPNPVESVIHQSGEWALRLLLLTLLMTPLRLWFRTTSPIAYRRMLGLFAFSYASVHLLAWFGLEQGFDLWLAIKEAAGKPYVLAGLAAFLALAPLAATSTRWMMRKLGRRWSLLHRLIYPATLMALVHYVWLVKGENPEPLLYLGVFVVLLVPRFTALLKR